MSSSLNDLLFVKVRNLLKREPSSQDTNGEIFALTHWNASLVDQVSERLLEQSPTEQNVRDLYYWGRFCFWKLREMNLAPADLDRLHGMVSTIDFMFKYLEYPTQIPFKYWSDIAPHLVDEVRRFRAQSKSYDEFWANGLDARPLTAKDKWLESNPETQEIWDKRQGESFGL